MTLLTIDTAAAQGASQFGVFEKLTDYGALGLIVLALGYVTWMFINKKLKENEELKKKYQLYWDKIPLPLALLDFFKVTSADPE